MAIAKDDLIEFKTGFRSPWQKGFAVEISAHIYKVRSLAGRLHTITLGGKDRSGKVRELSGARCVETVSRLPLPPITPALRRVQAGPAVLHAVPSPRPRYRSGPYLAFVRTRPCCGCQAFGPSDPHHDGARGVGQKADDYLTVPLCRRCHDQITDRYTLPGLTREETVLLVLRTQVTLLSEWAAESEASVADHINVPVLARCAS